MIFYYLIGNKSLEGLHKRSIPASKQLLRPLYRKIYARPRYMEVSFTRSLSYDLSHFCDITV